MYWSAGVSVVSNLPLKPDWPLKTHAWINAGRLDNKDKCEPASYFDCFDILIVLQLVRWWRT